MEFIADLHIHSHYSRATSKKLTPEYLDYYAGIKGIKLVGTGDFTHPGWLAELKEKTYREDSGFLRLKEDYRIKSPLGDSKTRFILTAEISNIYKRGGKVRKVHNVVLVPGFEEAEKINERLINLGGNLTSDGRPILGLDSRDLLEIVLDCGVQNYFIPAHIWTPWFSMLGSKSGFDSIQECFDDLTPHIHTIETGLSTDPPMNWLCSILDKVTLVSNSDAHSPEKLGRNANCFNTELSFSALTDALKTGNPEQFKGTIDMFPQEGKYHYDGHRKCDVCWNPAQSLKNNFICPKCKKPVTVGVMNRIIQLSDREDINERPNKLPFRSVVPLREILAEINGVGPNSKKVENDYYQTIGKLGNELNILLELPLPAIEKHSAVLAESIRRMRNREIYIQEGYDGEYGEIKVFKKGESSNFGSSNALFPTDKPVPPKHRALIDFDLKGIQNLLKHRDEVQKMVAEQEEQYKTKQDEKSNFDNLNQQQFEAVQHVKGPSLIIAGPGTGKTKTVTSKIAWIIANHLAAPEEILAITFTNKAAGELAERIKEILKNKIKNKTIHVFTFHGFGLSVLKEYHNFFHRDKNFILVNESLKNEILKSIPGMSKTELKKAAKEISEIKTGKAKETDIFQRYEKELKRLNAFDFNDLITKPVMLFNANTEILNTYRKKFPYIFVDEYQDTNKIQYELLRLLAPDSGSNLCVVGDINQAVYGFRGADPAYISKFKEDYPESKTFHLTKSYRCSQTILSASANILANPSTLLQGLEKGVRISTSEQQTGAAEAEFIARQIVNKIGGVSFFSIDSAVAEGDKNEGVNSLSDFAVLCRTKNQFEAIAKALRDHHVPYQEVGTKPFFHLPPFTELTDLLATFMLENHQMASPFFKLKGLDISNAQFISVQEKIKEKDNIGVLNYLKDTFFDTEKFDKQNWAQFLALAAKYEKPGNFINDLRLGSGTDTHDKNLEAVSLLTIHASKGLEFECVFISGCEDGLLPYNLYRDETDLEEERRLLYVGMTRAKKLLYLTSAKSRIIRGRTFQLPKSPFLKEIEEELIQKIKNNPAKKEKNEDNQLSLF